MVRLLKNKALSDDEELSEKGVGGDCDDQGENEMVLHAAKTAA
jgi:hypothetical protein